ncbi:MAG: hypothetical protein K8I82_30555 [Anaerolineae bacterium]|nr:hypothetical protein [Anaerolineae bacterium]
MNPKPSLKQPSLTPAQKIFVRIYRDKYGSAWFSTPYNHHTLKVAYNLFKKGVLERRTDKVSGRHEYRFTEEKTAPVQPAPEFQVGQRVHYLGKCKTIFGFTEDNRCAIISPTHVDATGNPVYTAVLLDDLTPCDCSPKSTPAAMPADPRTTIRLFNSSTDKQFAFQPGDFVSSRETRYRGYVKEADHLGCWLDNGNFYFSDELCLITRNPQEMHDKALCDVCEQEAPGVITSHGVNICEICRREIGKANSARTLISEEPYSRPAQSAIARWLEFVPPCTRSAARIADLVSEAQNTHTVSERLLLPAPKAPEPVPVQPQPKFKLGDYVVIDPAHKYHYGYEGEVTHIKPIKWHGQTVFEYAVGVICTGVAENFLHAAAREKPETYQAYSRLRLNWLGNAVCIWQPEGYYTYAAGANEIEIHSQFKGQWTPAGVYELFIPMNRMATVMKLMAVTRFPIVRLRPDGSVPPLYPQKDASVLTAAVQTW